MCADLTLWITRDLMVHCTLWTDPQVFTGGSLGWSQDKRQGTGVAGDLLDGSEQWLPPGKKDCCSFSPTPPSPSRSSVFLPFALQWPHFSSYPAAEFPAKPRQKISMQKFHLQVSVGSEGGSLMVQLVTGLLWVVETCTMNLNASPGVAWCGCQQVSGSWVLNPPAHVQSQTQGGSLKFRGSVWPCAFYLFYPHQGMDALIFSPYWYLYKI